jgi:hypothetical protein
MKKMVVIVFSNFRTYLSVYGYLCKIANKSSENKLEGNNDPTSHQRKSFWVSQWSLTALYYQAVDWQIMVMNACFPPAAGIESENCKLFARYECALEYLKSIISYGNRKF